MLDIKLGVCDFALPGYSAGSIKLASQLGFDGMQLGFYSWDRGLTLTQKWFRDYYLEEADKYNIKLPSLLVGDLNIYGMSNPRDSEKGQIAYKMIEMAVETAVYMKMEMVMLPSFYDGFINTPQDFENTIKALSYACKLAEPYGIAVTAENLLPIEQLLIMREKVGAKNFSVFYDSQNYWCFHRIKQAKMLEELIENNLLYPEFHAKDGLGNRDGICLLGDGDSDFPGIMRVLKKANYSGWIHIENGYDKQPLRIMDSQYINIVRKDIEKLKEACK